MRVFPILFALVLIAFPCSAQRPSLTSIPAWGYQLQDIDAGQIATNPSFQLIVMDYSSDGTDDTKFTAEEIRSIRESGKKAIAYFSIGEAEDYRFYWKQEWNTAPPAWLGPENPDWAGNFKVRFWHPDWQKIVFDYLDIIIAQGFDGIYLDIVDGFWYWMHENPEQPTADTLMLDFISAIRTHAESRSARVFYIIPQNPDDILHSANVTDTMRDGFFTDIDGVGVEDVFFPGELDEDNPYAPNQSRLANLREIHSAGKAVFSVEYLTQLDKQTQYIAEAESEGFIPFTCTRELNALCDGVVTTVLPPSTFPETVEIAISPQPVTTGALVHVRCRKNCALDISLIDVLGRTVRHVHAGTLGAGAYHFPLPASGLPPGAYSLLLQTQTGATRHTVMVVR